LGVDVDLDGRYRRLGELADDRVRRHAASQLPGSALSAASLGGHSSTSPRWRIPITFGLMTSWPSFQIC
jgi:hypothetical protein